MRSWLVAILLAALATTVAQAQAPASESALAKFARATVKIESGLCGSDRPLRGSGILFAWNTHHPAYGGSGRVLVLTSDHVVLHGFNSGGRREYCHSVSVPGRGDFKAELLTADWAYGLAVLELEAFPLDAAELDGSSIWQEAWRPRQAKALSVIGYPYASKRVFYQQGNALWNGDNNPGYLGLDVLEQIEGFGAEYGMSGGPVVLHEDDRTRGPLLLGILSHRQGQRTMFVTSEKIASWFDVGGGVGNALAFGSPPIGRFHFQAPADQLAGREAVWIGRLRFLLVRQKSGCRVHVSWPKFPAYGTKYQVETAGIRALIDDLYPQKAARREPTAWIAGWRELKPGALARMPDDLRAITSLGFFAQAFDRFTHQPENLVEILPQTTPATETFDEAAALDDPSVDCSKLGGRAPAQQAAAAEPAPVTLDMFTRATVKVESSVCGSDQVLRGSGVMFRWNRYYPRLFPQDKVVVLTSDHVVLHGYNGDSDRPPKYCHFVTIPGKGAFKAEFYTADWAYGLALLELKDFKLEDAELPQSYVTGGAWESRDAQLLSVIGFPFASQRRMVQRTNAKWDITGGAMLGNSSVLRELQGFHAEYGMSGGPVVVAKDFNREVPLLLGILSHRRTFDTDGAEIAPRTLFVSSDAISRWWQSRHLDEILASRQGYARQPHFKAPEDQLANRDAVWIGPYRMFFVRQKPGCRIHVTRPPQTPLGADHRLDWAALETFSDELYRQGDADVANPALWIDGWEELEADRFDYVPRAYREILAMTSFAQGLMRYANTTLSDRLITPHFVPATETFEQAIALDDPSVDCRSLPDHSMRLRATAPQGSPATNVKDRKRP